MALTVVEATPTVVTICDPVVVSVEVLLAVVLVIVLDGTELAVVGVAEVVTVSEGVVEVELVVRKTVPEGVVTTTTLGGVMATCGGSDVATPTVGVAGCLFDASCSCWWFMA